jgi:F420-non-reducing hydrogenase iron-sulfur subunit
MKKGESIMSFSPRVIAFCCDNSAYLAADMAGTMKLSYPEEIEIVRVPCSGRVDALHILKAFENGADGVLIAACYENACRYIRGNIRAKNRVDYVRSILKDIGIEEERIQIAYLAPNMGVKFAQIASEMVEKVKEFGPAIPS